MNKNTLKGYFKTGCRPTEAQFANLIDSIPADTASQATVDALEADVVRQGESIEALQNQTTNILENLASLENLATTVEETKTAVDDAYLMMDDFFPEFDRINLRLDAIQQNTIDQPEALDLGTADIDTLDTKLLAAIWPFCQQGIYESYCYCDAYGVKTRQFRYDEIGNLIPTGQRKIERAVGTTPEGLRVDYTLIYTLFNIRTQGNPAPNSEFNTPVYNVCAYKRYDIYQERGDLRMTLADSPVSDWEWNVITPYDGLQADIAALADAIDALAPSSDGADGLATLTQRIAAEETARANADTALQSQIDGQTGRIEALETSQTTTTATTDTLTQRMGTEETARATADATLQSQIDGQTGRIVALEQGQTDAAAATAGLTTRVEALEAAQGSSDDDEPALLNPTRVINTTSYKVVETEILSDIRTEGNDWRAWVGSFPYNGGTETWHYQLLSVSSQGLIKVVRTTAEGISLLTAGRAATAFTATEILAF